MPKCYGLSLSQVAILDVNSKNFSVINMVETISGAPLGQMIPLEIVAYWYVETPPDEKIYQLKLIVQKQDATINYESVIPGEFNFPTLYNRVKMIGFPVPAENGNYLMKIAISEKLPENWVVQDIFWPVTIQEIPTA